MKNDLITRAMLVSLRISACSFRKHDKRISDETNATHGAASDAGQYNKMLLPGDATSFKTLSSHIAATRVLHYAESLPWSDDGWRLLPIANYQHYTDKLREAKHSYDSLLNEFLHDYPALRQDARIKLNGMYRDEDYPSDVASRYSFGVEFSPVPSGDDFRVSLSQEEIDIIATRTEDRVNQAYNAAMYGKDGAVDKLRKCVEAIHERLAQPEAIFRDSLITNAREMCEILTRLNVADDPQLEALRRETDALATVQPETLRADAVTRLQTANQAQSILDAMTAAFGKQA